MDVYPNTLLVAIIFYFKKWLKRMINVDYVWCDIYEFRFLMNERAYII